MRPSGSSVGEESISWLAWVQPAKVVEDELEAMTWPADCADLSVSVSTTGWPKRIDRPAKCPVPLDLLAGTRIACPAPQTRPTLVIQPLLDEVTRYLEEQN